MAEVLTPAYLEDYIRLKTDNTKRAARTAVGQWFEYLCDSQPSPMLALRYIQGLSSRGLSDATIRQRYHLLHSFYEFQVGMELADRNPFRAMRHAFSMRQKTQVRPTQLIDFEDVRKLLEDEMSGKKGTRDKAMLAIMFGTGMRRSEVRSLNVGDIVVTRRKGRHVLAVARLRKTKAGKTQEQPLPRWCWDIVATLITQRNLEQATNDCPLFCRYFVSLKPGGRLSESAIYRIYKAATGHAPHSARATFTTKLKAQGFEDRLVAEALRHSTDKQVKTYHKRKTSSEGNAGLQIFY